MAHKSGFVAIIGKPNVGKSTLLNAFLKEKLAIVSSKPETTRNKILGILNLPQVQIIFVDTPGIHQPHLLLGKCMVRAAKSCILEADLILFMTDAFGSLGGDDIRIIELLSQVTNPVFLLINKIDLVNKSLILPKIDDASKRYNFKEIIPLSALDHKDAEAILKEIVKYLPPGPKLYPEDQLTDKNERFIVAELVREQVLASTQQEVPHAVAVLVEEMKERPGKNLFFISASIYVERDSQKAIVIGQKGKMLKGIGQAARENIEEFLGKKVYLQLWVSVHKNWRKDERILKELGYSAG